MSVVRDIEKEILYEVISEMVMKESIDLIVKEVTPAAEARSGKEEKLAQNVREDEPENGKMKRLMLKGGRRLRKDGEKLEGRTLSQQQQQQEKEDLEQKKNTEEVIEEDKYGRKIAQQKKNWEEWWAGHKG